jgi:selenocysteine lyase/cysteine desulfurase
VFTANASGAIRILAEAFPFRAGSRLILTADNHNSMNGLALRPAALRRRRARSS